MNRKIILASGSAQRRALMDSLDIEYKSIAANIDEKAIRHSDLKIQAEKIARAKGEKVAGLNPDSIVIAADTFLAIDGEIFEKPADSEEAKVMLKKFSGNQAEVFTGVYYIDPVRQSDFSTCVTNRIKFRPMSEEEIEAYTKTASVTSWSGGFSPAYAYGLTLFEEITGSPSAFSHGFPMGLIVPLLEKSGIKVKPKTI